VDAQTPVTRPPGAAPAASGRWSQPLPREGERFGPYRIQRLLGDGGMGVVLRARDEPLERDVALKLIQPELLSRESIRAAFLEEARAMASIRHPNVVHVYSLGQERGHPYFAMELFDDGNLERRLRERGPLAPAAALPILRAVGRGLAAIHRRGRIHGDVKPSNVLLTAEDDRVALTDMGLSHLLGDPDGGTVQGTPAYLAPERAMALAVPAHAQPRQDVYALAVVAFELLTGRLPFEAERADRLLELHAHAEPPPASRLRPELGPRFDVPLLRALRKDPSERTATALALVEELEEALGSDGDGRGLRFLVVDDDPDWRELLGRALVRRFPGAQVEGASDGRLGLAAARHHPPDAALIDLDMPELGGIELTHALRELAPPEAMSVVVLSGRGGASDWRLLRRLGADRFFVKPTPFDELCDTLEKLLARQGGPGGMRTPTTACPSKGR
jgi:serine/threonine-protein kinase